VQILTLSLKTHPLNGILLERAVIGIRWCISENASEEAGTKGFWASA
jgi:hypothetical protein